MMMVLKPNEENKDKRLKTWHWEARQTILQVNPKV